MVTGAVDGMYPTKPSHAQESIDAFNEQYPGTHWILAQAHTPCLPEISFSDEIGINHQHPLAIARRELYRIQNK
jgi:hypothetical protein